LRSALAAQDQPAAGATDPDALPAEVPTRAQLGDLWVLGAHRLVVGDSREPAVLARLMNGTRAALLATDPPYGVDYTATKEGMPVAGLGDARARWGDIANDALSPAALDTFLRAFLAAACPHLAANPGVYCWHPSGELSEVFRVALRGSGVLVHRTIIWAKKQFVLTRSGMYHWQHEPCFYGWLEGHPAPWYGEKNQGSVWHVGRDGLAVHPTQKPVELFEIPMRNHTRRGEVCLEPFSGSGSQIIAGERLERRVFAVELAPRWADAAIARWEAFTGQTAAKAP
jgi:DNA modification methylase